LGIAVADADLNAGEGGGARDTESDPVGGGRDIGDLPFEVLERRRLRELRFRRESWRTAGLWRAGLGCRSGRRALRGCRTAQSKAREQAACAEGKPGAEELPTIERLLIG